MIADRVRVSVIINPITRPKVRQHVFCSYPDCGWKGTIAEADIMKTISRQRGRLYICCPKCGEDLIDLSTDEPRRWLW